MDKKVLFKIIFLISALKQVRAITIFFYKFRQKKILSKKFEVGKFFNQQNQLEKNLQTRIIAFFRKQISNQYKISNPGKIFEQ